ncbi:hypothetical protein [Achromobacter aloeverae]|uniref:Uncharacterized protein n=1 Tax=Achromobacter aloeverae TaxID=1750518 RepID=A0A4Q1HID5_9BURK|nr:hypothetical protein [Achromobacter aloeverae]RXN87817.1 hypothetical protein C7R54_14580 [Achromobacter aloeverae]
MKFSSASALLLGALTVGMSTAALADVSIGVNIGAPPVYVAPPPPVYVAPPAPVYAPPPPVYYGPAPAVVVPGPAIVIGWHGDRYWDGRRYWGRDEWYRSHPPGRGHGHDRDYDDHDHGRGHGHH